MKKQTPVILIMVLALLTALMPCSLAEEKAGEPWEFQKFDPMITLYTDRWIESEEGLEDWNNRPYIVWCRENLGINWQPKFVSASYNDHIAQLQLLASTDDLPDVIADAGDYLQDFYNRGLIRDLSADIEKWGSPLTKYIWKEYEERLGDAAWIGKSSDTSKFFSIPLVLDPLESGAFNSLYIRGDIVEDLGYDNPTNFEELEEVMEAYKNAYPDKYPFSAAASMYSIWGGCFSQVFSMFNSNPGWFYPNAEGEYIYGSVQPETKEALAALRRWYANGWIDPNFTSRSDQNTPYIQGEDFIVAGQNWFPGWAQPQLEQNISSARIDSLGLIAGPNGEVNPLVVVVPTGYPAAISTNCEHPEAVIWEMNVLFESQLRNVEYLREMFDFSYPVTEIQDPINPEEVAEGKPARYNYAPEEEGPGFLNAGADNTPSICYGSYTAYGTQMNAATCLETLLENDGDVNATYNALTGAAKTWFYNNYVNYPEIMGNERATLAKLSAINNIDKAIQDGKILFVPHANMYVGYGLQSVIDYNGPLTSTETEYFRDIITGARPLDDFDQFVELWYAQGGSEMLKEVNAFNGVTLAE